MAAEEKRPVLGIDLGGTKVLFGVVDKNGRVLTRLKVKSATTTSEEIVTQLVVGIEEIRRKSDKEIAAVGIGVPGTVDTGSGHVVATANLPLNDVPLGKRLTELCGLPVVVGNDVTLCTLGEAWYGAGAEVDDLFGIFIGTGIGGGIIIDGKLYAGAHGGSGEVGHIRVAQEGPVCGCGGMGCLESFASRTAIERDIRKAVEAGTATVLTDAVRSGERLRSGMLRSALQEGDKLVSGILAKAAELIGLGIANVVNVLDPEVVVVGGGLIEACGDFMMPIIVDSAKPRMMKVYGEPASIVRSYLGDDAGIVGAAVIAKEALKARRPAGATAYVPQVEWLGAGEVQINGKRYTQDVLIRADGKVRKRPKKLAKRSSSGGNVLSIEEANAAIKGNARALLVGTSTEHGLSVPEDVRSWLTKHDIRLLVAPGPQAVIEFKKLRGPRALLLHLRNQ